MLRFSQHDASGPFSPSSCKFSFLLLVILTLTAAEGCKRFGGEKKQENARTQIHPRPAPSELKNAIERAGGDDVWIKGGTLDPPAWAEGQPLTVLVAARAFDRVLAAIRANAGEQGFGSKVEFTRPDALSRAAEIRLIQNGETMERCRLVETPRILRAAIVIDDLGRDLEPARRLTRLPYPVTFSVLPGLAYSRETAEVAHRAGREVLLHLPMEPEPGATAKPGPGEIAVGMAEPEVGRVIRSDLGSVPYSDGVNNHMGSRATADARLMREVMEVLRERNLFFIDSRTTASSTALGAARRAGLPAFYRSVFIDDTESVDYSLGQLRRFRRIIEEQGLALAIGHPYPSTIEALAEFIPELERDNIELVFASEIVRLPEAARLSPPARAVEVSSNAAGSTGARGPRPRALNPSQAPH
jgi:polysaccharide deacetylase 2 family uncharacterized protein YibQ